MIAVPVTESSGVAEARRAAVGLAHRAGFGETAVGRVALAATELATNLVKHGREGQLLAGLRDPHRLEPGAAEGRPPDGGAWLDLIAVDRGTGIADLGRALADGYSTTGTGGGGLGAIRRQAHAFHVYSRPGAGTALLARLADAPPPRDPVEAPLPELGAVCVPMPGEDVCGDDWHAASSAHEAGARTVLVVDGLGHGPQAAEAASAAVRLAGLHLDEAPAALMERLHAGLRATRGAAVTIARLDSQRRVATICGVGNVAAALVDPAEGRVQRLLTHNGTIGHAVRRIQSTDYPYPGSGAPTLVLHSDGVSANWSLAAYPGLAAAHPALFAAVLYRDFSRGRDDATVLVAHAPARAR